VAAAHARVRQDVPFMAEDRVLYPDVEAVTALVRDGHLVAAVEAAVGPL
jgi:histidine ammonia-lyase